MNCFPRKLREGAAAAPRSHFDFTIDLLFHLQSNCIFIYNAVMPDPSHVQRLCPRAAAAATTNNRCCCLSCCCCPRALTKAAAAAAAALAHERRLLLLLLLLLLLPPPPPLLLPSQEELLLHPHVLHKRTHHLLWHQRAARHRHCHVT